MGNSKEEIDEKSVSSTNPTSIPTLTSAFSRLPPPPPFNIHILNLTIGVPPPSPTLPFPIPVLKFLFRKPDPDRPKSIIHNVSADCYSGEMLAIIGGTGSGKTTLLNAIVGRLVNLQVLSGTVVFQPVHSATAQIKVLDSRHMKHRIGFVRQNDYLLPHLTVRETLSYAAALRLPTSVTHETRDLIVEETIQELGLQDAADTVVGGMFRKGISGGERRRLSIGCILVTLPSVLCLDEPTTGLDATTAFSVLSTLSRLSRRNRTIILSIHQPRSDAYALFSRIVLLSRGSVVYAGLRSRCFSYFGAHLGMTPPREGMNVLDWLIDISVVDVRTNESEEESRSRIARLVDAWRAGGAVWNENEYEKNEDEGILSPGDYVPVVGATPDAVGWGGSAKEYMRPGMFAQTRILMHRANKNVYRNLGQMTGFACQAIIVGILLALTFYRLPETPSGIQSLKSLAYQHLSCYSYLTLAYMVYRFCEADLVVFDREREDHLYTVPPYILSEIIANFPVNTFFTTLFALIVYFGCNLRTFNLPSNLFIFIAMNVLVQLCTVAFAFFVASLQRIYAQASVIANAIQLFLIIPAGYLLVTLPVYVRWVQWISMYFYAFHIAVISQFRNRTFACPGVTGVALSQCDGNAVLRGLHIPTNRSLGIYFTGLFGFFIVLNVFSGIALAYYHPGGVRHAQQVDQGKQRDKASQVIGDLDVPWVKVDVEARALGLKLSRRSARSLRIAGSWILSGAESERTILRDVNVRFPAGEVTAILGPSGAGKSSLLQLLASRPMNPGPLASFQTEGVITFNAQPLKRNMRGLVGFVEQDDEHHYMGLTVRETLRYAAMLRLPKDVPRKRKVARAEEVLYMLGLQECANTLVGGPMLKGISGGEKRRLSLAVQMISDPSILIADEPTSGLDALTANNVMNALKQIATVSGRTVIVTLHQPRSDIYHLIDNVVVLAKGGRVAYSGPRSEIAPMLSNAGFPIPPLFNPADFLLDTVSNPTRVGHMIDTATVQQEQKKSVANEGPWHQDRQVYNSIDAEILASTASTPMYIALLVVVERMVKNLWRQQPVFWIRLQQSTTLAILFLLFYQRLKHDAEGGQSRIGFLQEFTLPVPFLGLLNGAAIFPVDRDLFLHEYPSSARYSSATFILAYTMVELPFQILSSLLYTVLLNVVGGMQTNARIFFEDAIAVFCLQSFGESLGIAFASFTQSVAVNISLVSIILVAVGQTSGILSVSIPRWLNILAWGTITKYGVRIITTNELVGLKLNCSPESIASGLCLGPTGQEILKILGFTDLRTGRFLGIMVALTVANRILAWGVLRLELLRI